MCILAGTDPKLDMLMIKIKLYSLVTTDVLLHSEYLEPHYIRVKI